MVIYLLSTLIKTDLYAHKLLNVNRIKMREALGHYVLLSVIL
jgi:hypothetical protein